jgi:putative transposase
MKRSRYTEEQTIGILKEQEAGVSVAELCRKHGMSDVSFYKWKARYGGLEVSEARRLKSLEDENTRLNGTAWKKMVTPAAHREKRRRAVSLAATGPVKWTRLLGPAAKLEIGRFV